MQRSHRIIGAVGVSAVASLAGITTAGPAGAATSAQALYKAALKVAGTENVHFVSQAAESGTVFKVVGDTGKSSGKQHLDLKQGSLKANFDVVVVGDTGYVRGNATALQNILGLTAAQAPTYANQWLNFPSNNSAMADFVGGLLNKSLASELQMTGPYSFGGKKTISGQATQGIKGFATTSSGTKVPIVLYVETGATPRPVEEVTKAPKSKSTKATIQGTVTYSKWGEKPHIVAPAKSVSLLSLAPPA